MIYSHFSKRDNDQQNHWVQWGTQHFQTHPCDEDGIIFLNSYGFYKRACLICFIAGVLSTLLVFLIYVLVELPAIFQAYNWGKSSTEGWGEITHTQIVKMDLLLTKSQRLMIYPPVI